MTEGEPYCHCGQPLHYSDPKLRELVEEIIKAKGDEYVIVYAKSKSGVVKGWKVQRHYVALHGITGKNVETLGFEEVTQ